MQLISRKKTIGTVSKDKDVDKVGRYFKLFLVNRFKYLKEKMGMIHAQIGKLNRNGNLGELGWLS